MTHRSERETFQISPIERVDLRESVLDQLNGLIRSLSRGDRLPSERDLVSELNVSRVTVREALRTLEGLGKIETRKNAGSYVVDADGDPLAVRLMGITSGARELLGQLVDVRAAIEDRVVAVVVRSGVNADSIGNLLAHIASESEEDQGGFVGLDLRFESEMARLTGNPLLVDIQRSVHRVWVEAWSDLAVLPGVPSQAYVEHVAIYEAIRDGDVDLARRCMAQHVDKMVSEPHAATSGIQ